MRADLARRGKCPPRPVPCLVFLDAKPASAEEPQGRVTLALLARADAERVLLFLAGQSSATTADSRGFRGPLCGVCTLATPAAPRTVDPDAPAEACKFGFRWVRARAAQTPIRVAGCAAGIACHSADGARHTAVHPGGHRQGRGPPDHQHAHRRRRSHGRLHDLLGDHVVGAGSTSSCTPAIASMPCSARACSITS